MFSDFGGAKDQSFNYHARGFDRFGCESHKEVTESLEECLSKIDKLDQKVEKRLNDFLAQVVPVGNLVSEIVPPVAVPTTVQVGGGCELKGIIASEMNQLLSEVESLKQELATECKKDYAPVVDVEKKLSSMQAQLDGLREDVNLVGDNLFNLMSYLKARGTGKPLSITGRFRSGKFVVEVEDRL